MQRKHVPPSTPFIKTLFARRWLPTSPTWSVWYRPHIKCRYPYFLRRICKVTFSNNPDIVGRSYNPLHTGNSFELKTDTLYPVTICKNIEEAIALRTQDTYTFSLSTNPHAAHVISPMQNTDHIRSIGFSEYKNGNILLYCIDLLSTKQNPTLPYWSSLN